MYQNLIKYLVLAAFFYILAIALQTSVVYTTSDPEEVLNLTKASSAMLMISAVFLLVAVVFAFRTNRAYY